MFNQSSYTILEDIKTYFSIMIKIRIKNEDIKIDQFTYNF